ncbi:MAG: twin-arginine translocase TatA/TatE family subunit [Longimicrobiales bacterium]|nr:twin-arginine translocase TatA/TatE family subunit [Longimicrobiales bacterium]
MTEIILIFLVVLLLFGAKRLPEIGTSLGKGIREFKSSVREIEREVKPPSESRSLHTPPPAGPGARSEDSEAHVEPRRLTTKGDEEKTE